MAETVDDEDSLPGVSPDRSVVEYVAVDDEKHFLGVVSEEPFDSFRVEDFGVAVGELVGVGGLLSTIARAVPAQREPYEGRDGCGISLGDRAEEAAQERDRVGVAVLLWCKASSCCLKECVVDPVPDPMSDTETRAFESFFGAVEPGLRAALVAKFGAERGRDAAAEALSYGWRNWARVSQLDNPAGYLYRVGDRWGRRQRKPKSQPLLSVHSDGIPQSEPGLEPAMDRLTHRQRQAVVLVIGFGLPHTEAADILGLSRSSIQNHVERGLAKLRSELGVQT